MTLRDIIIQRILFAVTEETLAELYNVTEDELSELSDLDLFELYDDACAI